MTKISNEELLTGKYFWRLQAPGFKITKSFKSRCQNTGKKEKGLSCWSSLEELIINMTGGRADYVRGNVELVVLDGEIVDYGFDGEPVVKPLKEIARFSHTDLDDYKTSCGITAKEMKNRIEDLENINEFISWGWNRIN